MKFTTKDKIPREKDIEGTEGHLKIILLKPKSKMNENLLVIYYPQMFCKLLYKVGIGAEIWNWRVCSRLDKQTPKW